MGGSAKLQLGPTAAAGSASRGRRSSGALTAEAAVAALNKLKVVVFLSLTNLLFITRKLGRKWENWDV